MLLSSSYDKGNQERLAVIARFRLDASRATPFKAVTFQIMLARIFRSSITDRILFERI
jgi:hypothetical protein